MDESAVRQRAEAHGEATVAGDLKRAGADLDKSAYTVAGEVMKKLPGDLTGCEVKSVREESGRALVTIVYTGSAGSSIVESTWEERDGAPKIVDLRVI